MNKTWTRTAIFTALIIVSGFIKIPLPNADYFTLQTAVVLLSGMLLGKKHGFLSMLLYLIIGLIGIPVFAAGGGFSYIFRPSFGYLIGYAFGSFTVGQILEIFGRKKPSHYFFAAFVGLFVVYLIGLPYKYIVLKEVLHTPISVGVLLLTMFPIDLPGDLILTFISATTGYRLKGVFHETENQK